MAEWAWEAQDGDEFFKNRWKTQGIKLNWLGFSLKKRYIIEN